MPKGFVVILAQLKSMCDKRLRVVMMKGNHDCWSRGYLSELE